MEAHALVKTPKATRYLKALCNHFSHKVTAEHDDSQGKVLFGFGTCDMIAADGNLDFHVHAGDETDFNRVKAVVADHLERFSGEEALQVVWVDQD